MSGYVYRGTGVYQSPWDMLVAVHPVVDFCKGSGKAFRTARGLLCGCPTTQCPACRELLVWKET